MRGKLIICEKAARTTQRQKVKSSPMKPSSDAAAEKPQRYRPRYRGGQRWHAARGKVTECPNEGGPNGQLQIFQE